MPYTLWRNESTDVINNCQTYQEQFEQIKDEILTNRCQYEYHSEIVDKAMNDLNNAEYDTLTMLLQTQNISITRTALLKISLVNYLVALILAKTSNISSMICLMILAFSLELMIKVNLL